MQLSFTSAQFSSKKKQTRRDRLLTALEQLAPWSALEAVIEPHYPKTDGKGGRSSLGLSRMLRMYVLQQFSDEGMEDAIYDSPSLQLFMGIDLGRNAVPDATTLQRFRRLLEEHSLTKGIVDAVNRQLADQGLFLKEGIVVDATIISAPLFEQEQSQSP